MMGQWHPGWGPGPVTDVSIATWIPVALSGTVKGTTCSSHFAPGRDTIWLGSFVEKGVLLLKRRRRDRKYCKPELIINFRPNTGFV